MSALRLFHNILKTKTEKNKEKKKNHRILQAKNSPVEANGLAKVIRCVRVRAVGGRRVAVGGRLCKRATKEISRTTMH